MIGLRDALMLARAKRRLHRVQTVIMVGVLGLLLAAVFTALTLIIGVQRSTTDYIYTSNNGEYLVRAEPAVPHDVSGHMSTQDLTEERIAELEAFEQAYIQERRLEAEAAGEVFSEASVPSMLEPNPFAEISDAVARVQIVYTSPVYQAYTQQLQREYVAGDPPGSVEQLENIAQGYGATGLYDTAGAALNYMHAQVLDEGEEDLEHWLDPQSARSGYTTHADVISSVRDSRYTIVDAGVVERYLLPAEDREQGAGIPVVMTAHEAAEMFDAPDMPDTPGAQIAWIEDLRQTVNGRTYEVCYRDHASIHALTQSGDMHACSETGTVVMFQVVGLMHLDDAAAGEGLGQLVSEVFGLEYGSSGAFVPRDMYMQLPEDMRHEDVFMSEDDVLHAASVRPALIAFESADDARAFMGRHGCAMHVIQDECNSPWRMQAYGANYMLIHDVQQTAIRYGAVALLALVVLVAAVMFFLMVKEVASSRKETAIFRAVGARRRDIVCIYVVHACALLVWSLVVGLIAAACIVAGIQLVFGPGVTEAATLAFGVFGQGMHFSFIGVSYMHAVVAVLVLAVGAVSALLPAWFGSLLRPVKSLRD